MTKHNSNPNNGVAQFVKAARKALGLTQEQIADAMACTKANISAWENGRHQPNFDQISKLSTLSGVPMPSTGQTIAAGQPTLFRIDKSGNKTPVNLPKSDVNASIADYQVVPADEPGQEAFEIPYLSARGSCGGGSLDFEDEVKGKLIKERSFFKHHDLDPACAVVVYADGDSMADYIVDRDMVIFDKSKKTPISGKIFLINHPDGLRIKQLRREIDGTWVLESRNPDKRRYPDERVPPHLEELISIVGQFVYRQGGYF